MSAQPKAVNGFNRQRTIRGRLAPIQFQTIEELSCDFLAAHGLA